MFYVKDTISCNVIKYLQYRELEYLGLNIVLLPEMSITLFVIPSSNVSFYQEFRKLLLQRNLNREVILFEDMKTNWEDKSQRKKREQITYSFNIAQIIKGPTRITNSSMTQTE